ncbi:MAG TPA: Uma2 family endonuclease [Terriglobia bacterium]|nr:Uma2 family endonuclease [Terriglobia bacterium]
MAGMTIKGTATIEDLLKTPKDGFKYELADGEILMSPAGMRHSEIAVRIAVLLFEFLRDHPIGKVYSSDVGIQFPNGNVRSPDVTFVNNSKLQDGRSPKSYGELIPDLVVEVLSPSESARELGRKIGEYIENGVPLVWVVDPERETVTIYRSLTDTEQRTVADRITAEPVLPGFSADVRLFF